MPIKKPVSSEDFTQPVLPRSRARGPFPTAKERSREDLVAQWYGEENRPELLAAFHPSAQHIGKYIDRFLDTLQGPEERILANVLAQWKEIVNGDAGLLQLRPAHLGSGLLTLEVANPTLRYVLNQPSLKQLLLANLKEVGEGQIHNVRVVLKGRA